MIFVSAAHARPDVRNFLTSGNGCVQSPSFPYHVTKKRRALGTRMGFDVLIDLEFSRFAQAQLRKTGQITSLSTSQSAVFALCPWGLLTPITIGWDDAFDGNGKLKKKLSCFQFSTSQLMGELSFYLIMDCVAGGIKRK